ncbi:uncharacterized protein LOC142353338 isoform X2 [Convolutriloba macropyga]|uniref:uncharacterized protein LOC142353338 isoform X2 n=1 Tax=Convolutriloba macropyga TaxID=536237 RepID=UPI003F523EBD
MSLYLLFQQSISEIEEDADLSECDSLEDDDDKLKGSNALGIATVILNDSNDRLEAGSLTCSSSWKRLTGSSRKVTGSPLGGDQAIQDRILSLEEEVEYYKNALDEVQDRFQEADMLLIKDLKEENSKLGRDHRVLQYKYRRAQKELAEVEAERDTLMTEVHKNPSSADNPQDNKMLERLSGDDAFEALRRRFVESQEGKTRLQEENLRLQQEVQNLQHQQQQNNSQIQISSQEDLLHPDLDEKLLSRPRSRRRSRRDSELEAQVAKLEKDLETSRQREDEITEHLREAEDHIDHLEGQIQFIQDEKTRLLAIMDALKADNRVPEELEVSNGETVNALIARIHELEDESQNVCSQLRGLQGEYSMLDESFSNQKRQWEQESEGRKRELELIGTRLDVADKERQGLTETNDVLKNQLFQLENQCGAYTKEVEELYNKLQDTEWQLKESYSEIANLKIDLSFHRSNNNNNNSSSVIEHVHSEDSDSNTAPEGQDAARGSSPEGPSSKRLSIKVELENALLEVNQTKMEVERLKHALDSKNGDLEEKAQTIASLEARLRDADSIEERLNKTISVLRSEKSLLQKEVTLYRTQCSKLSEVKEENSELKAHVANLKVLLIEKTENVSTNITASTAHPIKKLNQSGNCPNTNNHAQLEFNSTHAQPTNNFGSAKNTDVTSGGESGPEMVSSGVTSQTSQRSSVAQNMDSNSTVASAGVVSDEDTRAEHDGQSEEHILSPPHTAGAEVINPCGQHFDDGSSAGQHTTTDYNTSGGVGGATTQDAINRMDKLIEANRNNSNNNNKQKGGGAKTSAAMPPGTGAVVANTDEQIQQQMKKYEEMVAKYEREKKKTEEDVAQLENILREVQEEKDKLEKRLKFEKESCEFQYKMEQKTWNKEKKTLEHKVTELEAKIGGLFDSSKRRMNREVTPPSLVFDSSPTSHSDPNSADERDDTDEVLLQRLAPLTIPTSVSSSKQGSSSTTGGASSTGTPDHNTAQSAVPPNLLSIPSTPNSRSRSASPNFLPRRLAGEGRNWEKQDLELHCAHLESEIDRLENDSEMYKVQVDELNFKVEQLDESIMKQKRSNELVEKEREQLQQRFVKSLRERSDQDVAFRAERQQWACEKEKLMLKLEEVQRNRTAEVRKLEQELSDLSSKLRESEKEKLKLQFELEKVKHEVDALVTSSQSQSPTSPDASTGESGDELDSSLAPNGSGDRGSGLLDRNVEKLHELEKEYLETQSMVNSLEGEIGELRREREELKLQLSEKETENLCWREWKESETTKHYKERENKFIQEKESILHELTECQSQISFLKAKLAEQVSGGDLAGKFQEWMGEVNKLHERYRIRENDDKSLLQQTKQQLKSKQQQWDEREKELKNQLNNLQSDMREVKKSSDERNTASETEITKLKSDVIAVKEQLLEKSTNEAKLTQQVFEQEHELTRMKKLESSLLLRLSDQDRANKKVLEGVKGRVELFLEQCRRNFHEARLQSESDLATSKHTIVQLKAEKVDLERQLETKSALLQEAQRSIEENRAKLMALQRETRNKQESLDTCSQQLGKMEFELQRKQQESLQLHQKLMAEQRRVVDIFNRHTNTLKIYQKQNRNSRNLENWEDSTKLHHLPSLIAATPGATAENTLDVVNEFRLINEELMISMEKSQNARKGEVEVLEQQIHSLKEEKLKQKQNLMTRINELEGQLRNVDLVHEQLKLAIDNCSKQQRLWQSEKQDLMKKNAELDLTKFSDRTKIYELQIEVNRMKRMADISSSERGSKMSGLESYTFERHEDSSSFSLDDNREPSKIELEIDNLMDNFLELSSAKRRHTSQTSLLSRVDSKKLQKSKSLDTDTDPLVFSGGSAVGGGGTSSSSSNTAHHHLSATSAETDTDNLSETQSYQKYPKLGGSSSGVGGDKEPCSSSLPGKYQKKQKSLFHSNFADRHKMKVLQRSNTNPLNQLEEHDGRGEGGSSELETTSSSLDRRALHSTSSPRHSSVSAGSTGSGVAAARSSSGGNTKKKNQFFSFFKDSTPKKDRIKADHTTTIGTSSSSRCLGSNADSHLTPSLTAQELSTQESSTPQTPQTPDAPGNGFSIRNSDCSLSIAGSWKDTDSACKTLDYPLSGGKEHKLKITQSETSIGISSGFAIDENGDDGTSETTSPTSTMSVPRRNKKGGAPNSSTLNKFTKLISSRSRSQEKQLSDIPADQELASQATGSRKNSDNFDSDGMGGAEKKWFFSLSRRKKGKAPSSDGNESDCDNRKRASSSSSVPEVLPENSTIITHSNAAIDANNQQGSTGSLEETLAQAARLVTQELGTLITEASDFDVTTEQTPTAGTSSSRRSASKTDSKDLKTPESAPTQRSGGISALERAKRALSPRRGAERSADISNAERSGVKLRPRASSPMPRPLSTSSAKFPPVK